MWGQTNKEGGEKFRKGSRLTAEVPLTPDMHLIPVPKLFKFLSCRYDSHIFLIPTGTPSSDVKKSFDAKISRVRDGIIRV